MDATECKALCQRVADLESLSEEEIQERLSEVANAVLLFNEVHSSKLVLALWECYERCAPGRFNQPGYCRLCHRFDPYYDQQHNKDCPVGKVEALLKEVDGG